MEYTEHLQDVRRRQERVRPADTPRDVVHPLGDLTVPEYVDAWAQRQPERAAVVHEDVVIDYRELAERQARWAGWLRAKGVTRGAARLCQCARIGCRRGRRSAARRSAQSGSAGSA